MKKFLFPLVVLMLSACSGSSDIQEPANTPVPSLSENSSEKKDEVPVKAASPTITVTDKTEFSSYADLSALVADLPVFGSGLHVLSAQNTPFEVDYKTDKDVVLKPVRFPEHFYKNMTDSVRFANEGDVGGMSSFAKQRESYPFAGVDEITIDAYFRVDLGNGKTNLFCRRNEMAGGEIRSYAYAIYAFNAKGSLISEVGKLDDFYVIDNALWGIWYYASDNTPHYEKTIQRKDGIFDEVLSTRKKPDALIPYLKK